jgi:hypothetical protein
MNWRNLLRSWLYPGMFGFSFAAGWLTGSALVRSS